MHACMHACMYVCMCININMRICIYVCMYACMHACMYVCVYPPTPADSRGSASEKRLQGTSFESQRQEEARHGSGGCRPCPSCSSRAVPPFSSRGLRLCEGSPEKSKKQISGASFLSVQKATLSTAGCKARAGSVLWQLGAKALRGQPRNEQVIRRPLPTARHDSESNVKH